MIESILKKLKKDPPKVVPNWHKKTISVTCDFGVLGHIKAIKIIAGRDIWVKWWKQFEQFQFKEIKECLSIKTSDEKIKALKEYAAQDPDSFDRDIYYCSQAANDQNPDFKFSVKTRGLYKEYKKLSSSKKIEISQTATHLYGFLYQISQKPRHDRPEYFKRFCKKYYISEIDLQGRKKTDLMESVNQSESLKCAVENVVSEFYDINIDSTYRFFRTFVTESPISLKRVKNLKRIDPTENPFLKKLFSEFIN